MSARSSLVFFCYYYCCYCKRSITMTPFIIYLKKKQTNPTFNKMTSIYDGYFIPEQRFQLVYLSNTAVIIFIGDDSIQLFHDARWHQFPVRQQRVHKVGVFLLSNGYCVNKLFLFHAININNQIAHLRVVLAGASILHRRWVMRPLSITVRSCSVAAHATGVSFAARRKVRLVKGLAEQEPASMTSWPAFSVRLGSTFSGIARITLKLDAKINKNQKKMQSIHIFSFQYRLMLPTSSCAVQNKLDLWR